MTRLPVLLLFFAAFNVDAGATCRAASEGRTQPLVELYTSEGCDSCPPADRWLASTFNTAGDRAIALAFHVDYWDRLGWKDRFANPAYTERQYRSMRANGSSFVYTPQVLVQGHEARNWQGTGATDAIATAAQRAALAAIAIDVTARPTALEVRATATVPDAARRKRAVLWLAYVDSGHVTDPAAGENRGVRLRHDHVVRSLHGPYQVDAGGSAIAALTLEVPREGGRSPALVAFVEDVQNGDTLQTVRLPGCW